MEKRIMLVKEFESDNQLITFLRSDLSLSLGFLGRILTRVEEKHAHYKLVVYYTNHNSGQLSLRVYKKKILEQLDEDYNERHFVTNDRSVETITQAA
ncbi:hypothetical protein KA013_02225 [Patescibacteria group bacterium]|nr:hypothetical protein [Patescibacteria group bacterium]